MHARDQRGHPRHRRRRPILAALPTRAWQWAWGPCLPPRPALLTPSWGRTPLPGRRAPLGAVPADPDCTPGRKPPGRPAPTSAKRRSGAAKCGEGRGGKQRLPPPGNTNADSHERQRPDTCSAVLGRQRSQTVARTLGLAPSGRLASPLTRRGLLDLCAARVHRFQGPVRPLGDGNLPRWPFVPCKPQLPGESPYTATAPSRRYELKCIPAGPVDNVLNAHEASRIPVTRFG